jgi:hypothetical protein
MCLDGRGQISLLKVLVLEALAWSHSPISLTSKWEWCLKAEVWGQVPRTLNVTLAGYHMSLEMCVLKFPRTPFSLFFLPHPKRYICIHHTSQDPLPPFAYLLLFLFVHQLPIRTLDWEITITIVLKWITGLICWFTLGRTPIIALQY